MPGKWRCDMCQPPHNSASPDGQARSGTSRSCDTVKIIKVSREGPIILQAYH